MANIRLTTGRRPVSVRAGVIFLILFSLPFAGGGTFVGYLAGKMVHSWLQAQSWEEVPARILTTDLESHRGDDSTTYEVTATYEYTVMGRTYTSHVVGLGMGSDNIGSFHQDAYRELSDYARSGRSFRCFVDLDDPSQALLYRDLRWGLLGLELVFALIFSGVGYGLMFVAVYGGRRAAADEKLREARPEQPWLWKKEWAEGRIPSGAKGKMIGTFVFAALWNLISAPIPFIIPGQIGPGNRIVLIGLIFPIIGVMLAAWAVHALLQWRKFGSAVFEMAGTPGVLGGYLEGRIDTNIRPPIDDDIELVLRCVRRVTTGSGKNRSTTGHVLWEDSVEVPGGGLPMGPHGASIPVRFAIPYDAGPRSDPDASSPVIWRLAAEAEMPGVDFGASFEVPVFDTEKSDPELRPEPAEEAGSAGRDPVELLRGHGIVAGALASGGKTWVFRRARALGPSIGLAAFTLIWCAIIWFMLSYDAPLLFPIAFGFFAILLILALVDMLLTQRRVQIDDSALTLITRVIGPGRSKTFTREEIDSIKPVRGMQSGNNLYFQIELRTRDGKKHILASQIPNQRLARRLVKEFEAALGSGGGGAPGTYAPITEPAPS